jgi:tetraacyldisaccharide 4'-kinase
LAQRAVSADLVVCTLKDAIKLGPVWPHEAIPLWYLSQRVAVERGAEFLAALMAELLAARRR